MDHVLYVMSSVLPVAQMMTHVPSVLGVADRFMTSGYVVRNFVGGRLHVLIHALTLPLGGALHAAVHRL